MISHLRGKIVHRSPTEIVVDVNGVGYRVNVSITTSEKLHESDSAITILTHLHVREDLMQLYGFATEAERDLFRLLISVSGIGPKMAQGILSGMSPAELREAIVSGNILVLTSISGVGKKTAERIVLELRNKMGKLDIVDMTGTTPTSAQLKSRSEALVALMSLGYPRSIAEKAIRTVLNELHGRELTVEELIKRALKHTSK
ncbi:MAG: Holliday junction branch migration protein RuvA [Ignavibacteria bacterium]|nr:Holliday junction branch migration protein RuvA [Ignavibacteria bacterium]